MVDLLHHVPEVFGFCSFAEPVGDPYKIFEKRWLVTLSCKYVIVVFGESSCAVRASIEAGARPNVWKLRKGTLYRNPTHSDPLLL